MIISSLIFLLGVIIVNGVDIDYPQVNGAGIGGLTLGAEDIDNGEGPPPYYGFADETCKTQLFDDDLSTGCSIKSSDTDRQFTWGIGPGEQQNRGVSGTTGMKGTFYATDVVPGINPDTGNPYTYYTITGASISFTDGCLNDMDLITQDSSFYYTDSSGTSVINSITLSAAKVSGVTTYTANLPYDGIKLFSGQDIGFNIQTNSYCENGMNIVEMSFTGEPAETEDPTKAPSPGPTPSPTTAQPTSAPTGQCKGEVTWGDPHFRLMAFDNDAVTQFNYQELGWFFYIAPCDVSQFDNFPFFLMSYHTRCYWRGNPKGCINNNKLILNTKDSDGNPDPIIIEFDYRNLDITLPSSGDVTYSVSSNALNGNGQINTNKNYKDEDGKRLEITYNDGGSVLNNPPTPNQSGTIRIFYDSDVIVVQLHDVQYDALPRNCQKNTKRGELLECGPNQCEDLVVDIRNKGSWTYFTCPHCLRNIACGLMGKYYRGDCTQSQLYDPNDKCSGILVGSDGVTYRDSSGRARGDDTFKKMADTWEKDYIAANVYSPAANFAKEKNVIFKHEKTFDNKKPLSNGRSLDITEAGADYYDGLCKNNITHIKIVNETCRQATVVKYEKCCKEIGICNILWLGCIEDFCSCSEPATVDNGKTANITDEWCLETIVGQSMNTTCSVDGLWPTATPTSAPTPSPTGLVAGLPQGQKAEDLIWLYLIFVVLFVVIAGVAYWYYRKKSSAGKASFQDDVETGGVPNTSVGY